ncbi:MAG: DUF1016 N-terminal domain-containing protein [Propionibacteriaceae bacterium]|nr:DUF1016 N-terminal domain-containing protein [Propionibacteriaceae bacterium]
MNEPEYHAVVEVLKKQIADSRQRALLAVNHEMVLLYWRIGGILDEHSEWGNKFITNTSRDLRLAYPDMRGLSERNLKNMMRFNREYPQLEFVQSGTAQIPWTHNITLLERVKDLNARTWYISQVARDHWTVDFLEDRIERKTYERQAIADKTTNFEDRLPEPHSVQVQKELKDPYIFDFIEARAGMVERESAFSCAGISGD